MNLEQQEKKFKNLETFLEIYNSYLKKVIWRDKDPFLKTKLKQFER